MDKAVVTICNAVKVRVVQLGILVTNKQLVTLYMKYQSKHPGYNGTVLNILHSIIVHQACCSIKIYKLQLNEIYLSTVPSLDGLPSCTTMRTLSYTLSSNIIVHQGSLPKYSPSIDC